MSTTPIDPRMFRRALGAFTTGVTIVTTVDNDGVDVGVTANSFNSVSLDPPMVLWSIDRKSTNLQAFTDATHFAVHILAHDQQPLAALFASRGADRFAGMALSRGPGNVPLFDGCVARFQCRTAYQYEGGDHIILVGEVLAYDHADGEPLAYKAGRYAFAVAQETPSEIPPPAVGPGQFGPDFLVYQLGRAYHQLLLRVLPELERRELDLAAYYALSMLALRDGRALSELDRMVGYTGSRIDRACADRLTRLGLVTLDDVSDPALSLTTDGQRVAVELMAAAQAASEDIETSLEIGEKRLLTQLLNRIITSTDPGLPSPWS